MTPATSDFRKQAFRIEALLEEGKGKDPSAALSDALSRLGSIAAADRCYVFLLDPGRESMSNTHEWCREGVPRQRERLQGVPLASWPFWMDALERDGRLQWPHVRSLPEEARLEREALLHQGVQSVVAAVLRIEDRVVGFIGFDSTMTDRVWTRDELDALQRFATRIAGLLSSPHGGSDPPAIRDSALDRS